MLLLQGCVQPTLSPSINHAAATVLNRLNIQVIEETPAACCGALHHHTSAQDEALDFIRNRIDTWWPHVEDGIEAIVSTASGCGVHIKEYGQLMANDEQYKDKAVRISSLVRDIAETISQEDLSQIQKPVKEMIAYHPPCTLQHGQKLSGIVETILERADVELVPVNDSHLCCGSAGSYSLLNPKLSDQLGQNKVNNLTANQPDMIVTANIGCLHHLNARSSIPVKHWIELLV
jgi:glycolate oxidase iron-sulfur subunit